MNKLLAFRIALGVAAGAAAGGVQAEQALDLAEAGGKCEVEVAKALQRLQGSSARELRFDAARRLVASSDGIDAAVRGEGHYRLAGRTVPFQYSCAYSVRTGEASGVVLREPQTARASEPAWEPDLSKVSPDACESATAALLKERNPRVARIAFDGETRRLDRADERRIGLEGRGALQRAPGMLSLPFSYRCEFDSRNGRIVAVQARD